MCAPEDLLRERLVQFSKSRRLPSSPSPDALTEWADVGCSPRHGGPPIKLESITVGRRRFTSFEAFSRWVVRLNS